ncbi:cyanamide hydratase [Atractiella rhizophila]|nr:cyanamide hydratase [Atractiella rhizophila]
MCYTVPLPLSELSPSTENPQALTYAHLQSKYAAAIDTPLVKKAEAYVKTQLPLNVFNHSHRAFYIAAAIAEVHFPEWKWDPETFYLSCLFHDLGCTPDNLKATKMSFEFFGAFLARQWLLQEGAEQDIADWVAETICRHTDFVTAPAQIVVYGQLIQLGTITDNLGLPEYSKFINIKTIEGIVQAWPREQWTRGFYDAMELEKKLKPWSHTTALDASNFGENILK